MPRSAPQRAGSGGVFIIVWRGWGGLIALFIFLGFVAGVALSIALSLPKTMEDTVSIPGSMLLAALAAWLGVKWVEEWSADRVVDQRTGEVEIVREDAGALFFIPSRYWPYVLAGLSILMFASGLIAHFRHTG